MPPFSSVDVSVHDDQGDFGRRSQTTGFTAALMQAIVTSKSKIEEWAEHEKAKADALAESYRQRLAQEQSTIDSQATELLAVEMERGMKIEGTSDDAGKNSTDNIAARKQALEEQMTTVQIEIMKLETERENREKRIKDIELEEKKQRMRVNETRMLKEESERSKKTTLDDLTRGLLNYKALGLDFVDNGGLRFRFTQIDPDDPSREFSFLLVVNEEEKYDIVDCNPPIEATLLLDMLDTLNRNDDMNALVRRIRKTFKEHCL